MSYYISCLETIANQEEGGRREKAQCLLDRYRKEPKPDYKIARRKYRTVNELSAGSKKEAPYLQSDDDDFQPAIPTTQKRKNLSLKRDKKSNVSAKKVKRAEENVDPFLAVIKPKDQQALIHIRKIRHHQEKNDKLNRYLNPSAQILLTQRIFI
ncbi:unnamed protein product [Rhizophagus irregularis]|nr:unnamed protein product [Rhizophagus irregularis]